MAGLSPPMQTVANIYIVVQCLQENKPLQINLLADNFKDLAQFRVILTPNEIWVIGDLTCWGQATMERNKCLANRQLPGRHVLVIREEKTNETLGKLFLLLIRALHNFSYKVIRLVDHSQTTTKNTHCVLVRVPKM